MTGERITRLKIVKLEATSLDRPEQPTPPVAGHCEYLPEVYDLTPDQIRITKETYERAAEEYADVEWSPRSIQIQLEKIVIPTLPQLLAIPQGGQVGVPACGSGVLAQALSVMRPDLNVHASDQSRSLIEIAQARYQSSDSLMGLLSLFLQHGAISNVTGLEPQHSTAAKIQFLEKLKKVAKEKENVDNQGLVTAILYYLRLVLETHNSGLSGVTFEQKDMVNQTNDDQLDAVYLSAVLQHLLKEDARAQLLWHLERLRPEGYLYFNLRQDPNSHADKGRTFRDDYLGPQKGVTTPNDRYYTTYSIAEIERLKQEISSQFPNRELVVLSQNSSHPVHPDKPPFIDFVIK